VDYINTESERQNKVLTFKVCETHGELLFAGRRVGCGSVCLADKEPGGSGKPRETKYGSIFVAISE
jgi:hypothetical protein